MNFSETCKDKEERRRHIREKARHAGTNEPNGIDYVEVDENQRVITVYFLGQAPHEIRAENVRITGGVRIRDIAVEAISLCEMEDPERDDCMRVMVDKYGDFSTYTLRLVNAPAGRGGETPLEGFDPRYAQIDFSFKANCPSDLDCLPPATCYKEPPPEPEINYLAKDYASFRQLILDRFSLIMPDWKETHVPDIGIAVVEVLAYVGDYLSYYQDAVATEAYLDTARHRISVRRHALLVDYQMHEGCNARAWVCLETDRDEVLENPKDVYFITGYNESDSDRGRMLHSEDLRDFARADYEVFEPLLANSQTGPIHLYKAQNEISFYTWHDHECCLPSGATSATLIDEWEVPSSPPATAPAETYGSGKGRAPQTRAEYRQESKPHDEPDVPQTPVIRGRRLNLKSGDVLIFEEVLGPKTGDKADADKSHRHAVRLIKVEEQVDQLYDQPIVYVEWSSEDALPFTLCISTIGPAPECCPLENVSVARGNVVLVDHGQRQEPETLTAPAPTERLAGCIAAFEPRETVLQPASFPAILEHGPLTHRAPFPVLLDVRRAQVQFLSRFMSHVRLRVEQLWKQTAQGLLLTPQELSELETIFGRTALTRVGLLRTPANPKRAVPAADQAEAMGKLLARFEEFMSKKARRVTVLRDRVLSGYVLTSEEEQEIEELFGAKLAMDFGFLTGRILGPACTSLRQQPREALPCIKIIERHNNAADNERLRPLDSLVEEWWPRRNLLASNSQDRHFVAEIDNYGRAHLRFGNGELGRMPEPNATLEVNYRVGNGTAGNVGAETISHIIFRTKGSIAANLRVRNPLPAQGGIDSEPIAEVKMFAPGAFRKDLQRAITTDDYARLAERSEVTKVQRAAADLRWAGSWYEVQTAIDPLGTEDAGSQFLEDIKGSLYRYRRIGHDLVVQSADYVALDIAMHVCVLPHYLRGHVKAELEEVFSNRVLRNGKRGFFHPDNLSFGEGVYLSRLVAAAQAVAGVESVRVTRLQRLFEAEMGELENGVLPLGPFEVARCDNDPSFPEQGLLKLEVGGGR